MRAPPPDDVELFWPLPARALRRYALVLFVGYGLIGWLIGGLLLAGLALAEGPGLADLAGHYRFLAPGAGLALSAGVVTGLVGMRFELWWARAQQGWTLARLRLDEGERLEAFCPVHIDRQATVIVTWGEYLAVTDRRLLRLKHPPGRFLFAEQHLLCDRDEVAQIVRVDRGAERHPLKAAVLRFVGQVDSLDLELSSGRGIRLDADPIFFEPLVDWLRGAGFRLVEDRAPPSP